MPSLTNHETAIAVIGMSCRFPGANDVETFYQNLLNGVESIRRFSLAELVEAGVSAELAEDPAYVPAGGVLDEPYAFDAELFGYSAAEAALLDPQHRWFLQCAWEALESAGHAPGRIKSPVGVFAGCSASTHRAAALRPEHGVTAEGLRALVANDKDYLATRLSFALDLRGPSMSVQTACSTSLVAVHVAAQALLAGECSLAIAGGATIALPQHAGYLAQDGMILSPDGRCRAFDADANGVVGGNGVGVVVLKRLSEAVGDRDPIRAVIRGSAVTNDGADKLAFTAPSAQGQARAIAEALGAAGVSSDDVGYVEAHGTGTALGDPVEIRALSQVFGRAGPRSTPCALGSVKNNIGHLDAAAGIASFIKACMIVERGEIPPTLHFRRANPHLALDPALFYVPTRRASWPSAGAPRRAGVSSFGFGGTNAHVVVEQHIADGPRPEAEQQEASRHMPPHVVALSAQREDGLRQLASKYLAFVEREPALDLDAVSYTTQVARRHCRHRAALVVRDRGELLTGLRELAETAGKRGSAGELFEARAGAAPQPGVVFLFAGQGTQFRGMGRDLYVKEHVFREAFDACAALLAARFDLRRVVFDGDRERDLDDTRYAQPALFALGHGLVQLWRSWGIRPVAVLGHSLGELLAAHAAGAFSLEAALHLVARRAELTASAACRGSMVAVLAERAELEALLRENRGKVWLAAVNGERRMVISGEDRAVQAVVELLAARDVPARVLRISHAFHSPCMEPALPAFRAACADTAMRSLELPLFRGRDGLAVAPGQRLSVDHWCEQLVQPVEFARALRAAASAGHRLFLEIGPDATLSRLGAELLPHGTFVPSLQGPLAEQTRGSRENPGEPASSAAERSIEDALARLYVEGYDPAWSARWQDRTPARLLLPTYPFAATRHGEPQPASTALCKTDERADHEQELLVRAGNVQAEAGLEGLDLNAHQREEEELEDLAAIYFRRAFTSLGMWTTSHQTLASALERAGVAPRYGELVRSAAEALAARGELRRTGPMGYGDLTQVGPETLCDAERAAEPVFSRLSGLRDIVHRPGRALADVLRGRTEPRELMFREGTLDDAYAIYRDLPTSRYFNGILRELVRSFVNARGGALRILEIGAGTGATTEQLLPLLDPAQAQYLFTDVSPLFLERAKARFGGFPGLECRVFDVARAPSLQGLTPHDFDIVIAANALHAVADLREALGHVRALVAPGGLLALYEITENSLLGDLTTTLLMPSLSPRDPRDQRTFLSLTGWRALLREAGFSDVTAFPEAGSPAAVVGERVLTARAPGRRATRVSDLPSSRRVEAGDHPPEAAAPSSSWLYQLAWRQGPHLAEDPSLGESSWVICVDRRGVGVALARKLRERGAKVLVLSEGPLAPGVDLPWKAVDWADPESVQRSLSGLDPALPVELRRVVDLRGLDLQPPLHEVLASEEGFAVQVASCQGLMGLIGALESSPWAALAELRVVTETAEVVEGHISSLSCSRAVPRASTEAAPLLGVARVAALGHPLLRVRTLDVDEHALRGDQVLSLVSTLVEDRLALRGQLLWLPRLVRAELPPPRSELKFDHQGTYLVTGGRGGLGLCTAEWLAARGAGRIVLLGRSAPDAPSLELAQRLQASGVDVELIRGDVGSFDVVRGVVEQARALKQPLRGVVHAAMGAGSSAEGGAQLGHILWPKIQGLKVLEAATEHCDLELFLLFSSAVTLIPAHGLPAYVAANASLDAFAARRRANGKHALSVSWGAFRDVGTVAAPVAAAQLARNGLRAMVPRDAFDVLERALQGAPGHLGIFDADWEMLLRGTDRELPFYREIAGKSAPAPQSHESAPEEVPIPSMGDLSRESRIVALRGYLRRRFAETLRLPQEALQEDRNLLEYGLDSLMFLAVASRLSKELAIRVSPAEALRDFTVEAISRNLAGAFDAGLSADAVDWAHFFQPDPERRHAPFPLNDVQQAYWLGRSPEMVLGGVACHGYLELDCDDLDIARLEQAFEAVLRRHDMLRAVVQPDGSWHVLPEPPPQRFEQLDLRREEPAARAEALEALRRTLAHRVPDPERWPLCSVRVTRLNDRTTRVHVSFDNLVLDGRSTGIVLREWAALYADPTKRLPELTITSRDYTLAQRAYEASPAFAKVFAYWEARLDEMPLGPELPLAKDPASISKPRFSRRGFTLDRAHFTTLQERAAARGLTAAGVLLSAYAEVLARFSRRGRFTLAVPSFQRIPFHPQVQDLVGEFTTIVPLVIDMSSGSTFRARARAIQEQLVRDLEQGPVSGVKILRELRRRRTGELLTPVVFTSVFGLEREVDGRYWEDAARTDTLGKSVFTLSQTPQVLLDHHVHSKEGRLEAYWDAVEEAFDPAVLDAMFEAYRTLVQGLSQSVDAWEREPTVALSSADARARAEANATDSTLVKEPLHAGFRRQCERQPEQVALVSGAGRFTYRRLGELVTGLVRRLRKDGVRRGALVALVMERGFEQVVGALGVVEAGAAYLPIDATLPQARVRRLLEESGATYVVTQPWLSARFSWPSQVSVLAPQEEELSTDGEGNERSEVESGDVAYVIYTSGSTGAPKGVVITHGAAQNTIADINERFAVGPEDRVLALSSLSFDLSVYDVFGVLGAGGCLVQVEAGAEKDPARWAELMRREGVTLWNSVPALMQMLVDGLERQGARDIGELRCALLSGDWIPIGLPARIRERWPSAEVVSLGGATEASIWSIFHRIEGELPGWSSVPYGKPLKNQRWYVLNERWEHCPEGVAGELYIGGAGLAQGYHRDAARTAERFVTHPRTGERLYRTGDWGRYRSGGVLELLGREDTQVKVGGHRIELGEIESVLQRHPGVKQSLVVAHGEARSASKRLVAYVVLERAESVTETEVREHAARELPEYMLPRTIVELRALPLSANGKIDRAALPMPANASARERVAPSTYAETALVELWRELLKREQVSVRDHFFELGGDSLLATRISSELRRRYQLELPVRSLLSEPVLERVAALAKRSASEGGRTPRPSHEGATPRLHPLSFAQERFWFFEQLLGPSGAYNIPVALALRGRLDVQFLQRSLDALAARHEMLRARLVDQAGELGQVLDEVRVPLEVRHVGPGVLEGPDVSLHEWLSERAVHPFALREGGLIRATLVTQAHEEEVPPRHILLLVLHHAVADGWSLGILLRDLAELYAAFREGRAPRGLSTPMPYTEHARRERERAHEPSQRTKLANLVSGLRGAPQVLSLPLDRPRPEARSLRGDTVSVHLTSAQCALLRAYAAKHGGTAFMGLLSAFAMLLSRISGSNDVMVGSPVANRDHADVGQTVGTFVNTLALRVKLEDDPSFHTVFARCRDACLNGLANQDVPFEQVVEALAPPRATSHTPIFQVMLAYQSPLPEPTMFGDLAVSSHALPRGTALFDLTLHLSDAGHAIEGLLEFAVDVFDRSTASRLARQYQELLGAALSRPDVPLSALGEGPTAGARAQLPCLSGPPMLLPREQSTGELILSVARRCPDAPALRWTGGELSYGALEREVHREAARLRGFGVRAGDVVGVVVPRDASWVITQLALLVLGAIYLPLDSRWPRARRIAVLGDSGARFLICAPEDAVLSGTLKLTHLFAGTSGEALQGPGEPGAQGGGAPDSIAYLIYTSGSTGVPKGVPTTHAALLNLIYAVQAPCSLGPGARVLQFASAAFDASIWEVFATLGHGGCVCLTNDDERVPGRPLAEFVRQHAVTHALLTPSVLTLLDERAFTPCTTLLVGGEACPLELARAWARGRRLLNAYGPTECAVITTLGSVAADATRIGLGEPIANMRVCVLDDARRPVPLGACGELCIAGAGVMAGYVNRPDLNAERLVFVDEGPAGGTSGPWYRTGDRVRLLGDGTFEYLGRLDRQIKLRGLRIELGEIEAAIAALPGVRACAAVAVRDPAGELSVVAYVVPGQGTAPDAPSLREQLSATLPEYMQPARIVMREAFPMTSSAKVDLVALERESALALGRGGSVDEGSRPDGRPPSAAAASSRSSAREERALRIWREITGASRAGLDDDFFALGGHSLAAVRAVQRLRDEAGLDVPLTWLFTHPTPRKLLEAYASQVPRSVTAAADTLRWLTRQTADSVVLCLDAPGEPPDRFDALAAKLEGHARVALVQLLGDDEALEVESLASRAVRALERADLVPSSVTAVLGWSFACALAFEVAARWGRAEARFPSLYLLDGLAPALARKVDQGDLEPFVENTEVDSTLAALGHRYAVKLRALARYVPPLRDHPATVIATRHGDHGIPPDRGWKQHVAGELRVVEVDAAHDRLLKRAEAVGTLAELIARELRRGE